MMDGILERYRRYLQYERGMSELSIVAYLTDIEHWLTLEGCNELEGEALEQFLCSVDTRRARKSLIKLMETPDTTRSVKRRLSALRSLYGYLMKVEKVEHNPFKAVQVPKDGQYLPTFVNANRLTRHIERLYKEAEEEPTSEGKRVAVGDTSEIDLCPAGDGRS